MQRECGGLVSALYSPQGKVIRGHSALQQEIHMTQGPLCALSSLHTELTAGNNEPEKLQQLAVPSRWAMMLAVCACPVPPPLRAWKCTAIPSHVESSSSTEVLYFCLSDAREGGSQPGGEGAWAVAVRAQGEAVDRVLPLGLYHQLVQLVQRQETWGSFPAMSSLSKHPSVPIAETSSWTLAMKERCPPGFRRSSSLA